MQNAALAEALPFGRFLDKLITSLRIWGREVFRGKDIEEKGNLILGGDERRSSKPKASRGTL